MKFTKLVKSSFNFDGNVNKIRNIMQMIDDESDQLWRSLSYVWDKQEELSDEQFAQLEQDIQKYAPALNKSLANMRLLKLHIQKYEDMIDGTQTSVPTNLDDLQ